ncbi:MAG: mechanosensitive ion channel [Pseudomonadales bacterium]|nr:mechanosensitive ion channel [Pseudomonadales bacterium]
MGSEILYNSLKGEVIDMNARSIVMRTRDWKTVHIPNRTFVEQSFVLYTKSGRRRSSITLGTAPMMCHLPD